MSINLASENRQLVVAALLVAISMLAMTLRLYGLDADTLSVDEMRTATRAQLDLPSLVALVASGEGAGVQLPLMYIVTHFFVALFGDSELILRLQAVLFGSISILLAYRLGEILWTEATGVTAAFLLAVNPYHVQYSQLARHYALMVFLALLSIIFLLKALQRNRWGLWIGFVLSTSLSLYNHYFAFLFLAAEVVFAACIIGGNWLVCRRQKDHKVTAHSAGTAARPLRQMLMFLVSFALITMCYLPWLSPLQNVISQQLGTGQPGVSTDALQTSLDLVGATIAGYSSAHGAVLTLWLALSVVGFGTASRKWVLLILLWIGVPFAFASITQPKHFLHPRYVLFILPLYLLLVASALTALGRILVGLLPRGKGNLTPGIALTAVLTVLIFGGLAVAPLRDYYAREKLDWRTTAGYLKTRMLPGDVILYPSGEEYGIVDDGLSFYLHRHGVATPTILRIRLGLAQEIAENLGQSNAQAWLILYSKDAVAPDHGDERIKMAEFEGVSVAQLHDPSGNVLNDAVSLMQVLADLPLAPIRNFNTHVALAEVYIRTGRFAEAAWHLDLASTMEPHTQRASRHLTRTRTELEQLSQASGESTQQPSRHTLGLQVALLGYDLPRSAIRGGEPVHLTIWWQSLTTMEKDYTAFVHVVDPVGHIWAQQDTLLQDGDAPTSRWEFGETVQQEYVLHLPSNSPLGDYVIVAGLYSWQTGNRLPIWDAQLVKEPHDAIELARVTVIE